MTALEARRSGTQPPGRSPWCPSRLPRRGCHVFDLSAPPCAANRLGGTGFSGPQGSGETGVLGWADGTVARLPVGTVRSERYSGALTRVTMSTVCLLRWRTSRRFASPNLPMRPRWRWWRRAARARHQRRPRRCSSSRTPSSVSGWLLVLAGPTVWARGGAACPAWRKRFARVEGRVPRKLWPGFSALQQTGGWTGVKLTVTF